jgi:alpha-beta hydrolase superfamily lysophospholipase
MKWLPDNGEVKAVLQLAHGIVEHIGRYDEFARFMAESGFAVVGNSHLGHGRSAAESCDRGFFAEKTGWFTAVDDMRKLYDTTRLEYPAPPYFLLGHSMGSFMSRTFLIRHPGLLTGCVLSGTGQQSGALVNAGLAVARCEKALFGARKQSPRLNTLSFGAFNKRIPGHRTPYDWLSRDPEMVDKYIADEDSGYVPTAGLFCDMLGGIRFIGQRKNIAKMNRDLPILLVSGSEDPVGEYGKGPRKVFSLFQAAGMADVILKLYDGARHEILNETNRRDVYADILDWISSKLISSHR